MINFAKYWYQEKLTWLSIALLPLSWLFGALVNVRTFLYTSRLFKQHRVDVPVIVVGNITVGGTGKTPMVIYLVHYLRERGWRPGMISRGCGAKNKTRNYLVKGSELAEQVGDEALLLVKETGCPLVVGVNKVAAARKLLQETDCNIIISDDGLQHYRLERDLEICMIDSRRQFGNAKLLPAGPLRESTARLNVVDLVVYHSQEADDNQAQMALQPVEFINLYSKQKLLVNEFVAKFPHVRALAGIGHPERFFLSLQKLGLTLKGHAFPDHHLYTQTEITFNDELPVIMTAKDAVKCHEIANKNHWYLNVAIETNEHLSKLLLEKIKLLETQYAKIGTFTVERTA